MAIALVAVSLALAVCLYMLLMRTKDAPISVRAPEADRPSTQAARGDERGNKSAEAELEKKRKELEELKKQFGEMKDELKTAKKKLFDHKESGKVEEDLVKARADVERQASIQLESTRAELANALAEVQKLKSDEGKGGRRSAPAAAAAPVAAAAAAPVFVEAKPSPAPQKVVRELSDTDRDRIARAEAEAGKARQRIADLEKAMKNSKGRGDAATHQLKVARQESTLAKDKFRALEHRVNRLMLERDLMVRAIKELEKKSGISAERVELTPDEIAASDAKVTEKQVAEDKAAEDARSRLEAADAAAPVVDTSAPVAPAEAATAPAETTAPAAAPAAAAPAVEAAAPVAPAAIEPAPSTPPPAQA